MTISEWPSIHKKGVVVYGKDGANLVGLKVNADGELVVNLEAATVNIGDVDIASITTGTNIIGRVGIDQTTANANEVVLKSASNIGATTDAVASISADEDGTARSLISIAKAAKNIQIDEAASLVSIKSAVEGATPAGTNAIGKVITPSFSTSDSLTRPANATVYAANKSMNCSLTVTAVSYVGGTKTVTLTSNGHPLAVNDRITVVGINAAGTTFTNIDGNWVVSAKDANTFSFVVASTPTGTTPQTGLSVAAAVSKCLSLDVGSVVGGGIIISRLSIALPGVAMTGAVRAWIYSTQPTVTVDQTTFTLLAANDANRKTYIDLYPVTAGSGSDMCFAEWKGWELIKCDPAETRLYLRLEAQGAGTPASAGVITVRAAGVQLLG
jgi:hypothetical protein